MTTADIQRWIAYWTNGNAVNFAAITSLADMTEARRWCSVMRRGVFSNVTDDQLWNALQAQRGVA